jgi:hypothetical protein
MPAAAPAPCSAPKAILWGGLLAGGLDLVFAFAYHGLKPGVMQAVAGGLIGRAAAREGGMATFGLGLALHFLIALLWAAAFWAASRRLPGLLRHAGAAGLGFGLVVYYGMNCVVLPLSALQTRAWPPPFAPWPVAAHLLLVGLPIALAARRFATPPAA